MGRVVFAIVSLLASPAAGQVFDLRVTAPPVLNAAAERVRAIDREDLASALGRTGLEIPPRVQVTLIAEDDPRARTTPGWIVGRAYGVEQVEVFPQRATRYPYESLEVVVRHEVVHLALTRRAGGARLPRWFHEGVATAVEGGWGVQEQFRLLTAALDRPTITDVDRLFASESAPETAQAYLLAAALVSDIRERHGDTVPGRIAQHVAHGMGFDAAFARETGETVDEATARAWTGYHRLSRWLPTVTGPTAVWTLILALSVLAFLARMKRRLRLRRQWAEQEDDDDLRPMNGE